MKDGKRKVWDTIKKVVYVCATFLVVIAILSVALYIGKVVFDIVMSVICIIGILGIAFVWGKFVAKLIYKGLRYIEQRKNRN